MPARDAPAAFLSYLSSYPGFPGPALHRASKLLEEAITHNVAFVPGAPFFANDPQLNTLRLSFVTSPPEKIRKGIAVLGEVLKKRVVL